MNEQQLHEAQDARGLLRNVAYDLSGLASVFSRTGNEQIADELLEYANQIIQCHNVWDNVEGDSINEQVRAADQATANMFRVALNVIAGIEPK